MEQKDTIGAGKFESGLTVENTAEEIRITTNTRTEKRTSHMESTSHDGFVEIDARSLIETKKRKRHAVDIAIREEKMMVGDKPDEEERTPRVSQLSLRNQTTKERERDAVVLVPHQNTLRNQSTKGISLERLIAAEIAIREEMMGGDHPEEERIPRCSQLSLRNQTTKERERDAVVLVPHQNTLRYQSTRGISLERLIAAEIAIREEMMGGDHPEEERIPRCSQLSLRNQTTEERERDAVVLVSHENTLRNQATKGISLERQIAAEIATREEKMMVGDHPEEERMPPCSQSSRRDQTTKEGERDAVVLVSHQNTLRNQSTEVISLERQIAAETAIREEKMMVGDQPEEDRIPPCSQSSLRNQTRKERERDAVVLVSHQNTLRNQSTKVISLERQIAATLDADQKLKAKRDELMRDDAQLRSSARLQSELDNALSDKQDAQIRCEKLKTSEKFFKKSCRELEAMKNAAEMAFWEEGWRAEFHEGILCDFIEDLKRKDQESMETIASMQADTQKLVAELGAQKQKADAQILSLTSDKTSLQKELDAKRIATQTGKMVRSMPADKQNLVAELGEQKQKADAQIQSLTRAKTSLQNELDAARIAIQTGKSEHDKKLAIAMLEKENVDKKLALVQGERDATSVALVQQEAQVTKLDAELAIALTTRENLEKKLEQVDLEIGVARLEVDRQKALVIQQHSDKLRVRNTLVRVQNTLIGEKQKLVSDVVLLGKQAAEQTRKLEACKKELDEARTDIVHLKMDLEYLREEKNQWKDLEHDVRSVEQEAAEDEGQLLQAHSNIVHLQKTLGEENNRLEKLENDIRLIQEEAVEYERALKQAHIDMFHLKEKLESDVNLMREEAAEDKRKLVQGHKNELDQTTRVVIHLNEKLESDVNLMREEAAEDRRKLVQVHKNELDQTTRVVNHQEMELVSLREEKKLLEIDVSLIRMEAAQDKRKLVEAHKNALDEARTKAAEVKRKMLQGHKIKLTEARTTKAQLKKELESLRKEKERLENDLSVIQEEAAEENKKRLESHKIELDEARTDTVDLRKELESSWEERNRLVKLEYDANRIQEEAAKDKRALAQTVKELHQSKKDIVGLEREMESLREAIKRLEPLEDDISRIQEQTAEDKRKLIQEHKNELDGARTDIVDLKLELESLREEKNQLDGAQKIIMRNLEEEKDRSLCQICMQSPKDTISFPCLHLQYCFSCLEKHRKRSNTCPSCRSTINGVTCLSVLS